MQSAAVSQRGGQGLVVIGVPGRQGERSHVVARKLWTGLVRQLGTQGQLLSDGAKEVGHGHAAAMDQVGIAQRQGSLPNNNTLCTGCVNYREKSREPNNFGGYNIKLGLKIS